jgi:hypothetical protein
MIPNARTSKVDKMNDLNSVTDKIHEKLNKLTFNSLMGFLVSLKGSKSRQTKKMIQFVDFRGLEPYVDQTSPEHEMKGPYRYPSGATYFGQYKGALRHGYGT